MNQNLHPQLQKCHEKFNLQNSSPLFDYSETVYEKVRIKLNIKCLKCNTYFEQFYQPHLIGISGKCKCNKNAFKFTSEKLKKAALIRAEKKKQRLIESEKKKIAREKAALIRDEKKKQKLIESEKAALIRAEKKKQRLIESEKLKLIRKKELLMIEQNRLPLFIKKAQSINDNINEFNYDKVEFKTIGKHRWALNIKCNKCSLLFDQRTDKHLEGQGCKRCRSHIHDIETYRGRPTTLYYIKVDNLV